MLGLGDWLVCGRWGVYGIVDVGGDDGDGGDCDISYHTSKDPEHAASLSVSSPLNLQCKFVSKDILLFVDASAFATSAI